MSCMKMSASRLARLAAASAMISGVAVAIAPGGSPAASATCVTTESWVPTKTDYFRLPGGLFRSQGLTVKGSQWFFSWQYGLERTRAVTAAGTTQWVSVMSRPLAIPPDLLAAGSNHIGDIDTYGNILIAPIEDGPAYLHPRLVFYNTLTMLPTGERYELPRSLLTEGVPWVAVDHTTNLAIAAEWNNTSVLNFFDIRHGMALHHQVTLDRVLGRIQGAKVYQGTLWASRDDAAKSVISIDLHTGHVTDLFALHLAGEMEGIAMAPTAFGEMHVMFIHGNTKSANGLLELRSSLHHFARVAMTVC